jgi:annexin A7/11
LGPADTDKDRAKLCVTWIEVEINLTLVSHWFSNILILSIPDEGYYVPDEGYYVPDEGYYVPDEGYYVPDGGYYVPDEGYYVPDEGYYVPDGGYYVPDEGYSRNASCALNLISTFFFFFHTAFAKKFCKLNIIVAGSSL